MRKKRLEALAVRDLSELIMRRRLKDDRIGLVSVTGVKLTQDLAHATVYVSPFGTAEENEDTWRSLLQHAGFLQSEMGRNLRLRQTPKIRFELDDSIRKGDAMLDRLEEKDER